jgi:anthranilate synthase component 1
MAIERSSHLIHLVSNVAENLRPKRHRLFLCPPSCRHRLRRTEDPRDANYQRIEPEKRGLYAGAIGYCGYNGNLDTCIVIRTIVMKGKKVFINAGAGIVADSDPDMEYQETLNKARAMLKAVELAEQWRKK